jgi:type III pantothenate kinase
LYQYLRKIPALPVGIFFEIEYPMANLIIDRGNTLTKWALFEADELVKKGKLESKTSDTLLDELMQLPETEAVLLSSVKRPSQKLEHWVSKAKRGVFFTYKTPIPVKNAYTTPETLGLDRLAAAIGAWNRFPESNSLVIDMGTCIKYDFITANGEYLGGNISPGMTMRFQALNRYTDKLPLLGYKEFDSIYGNSTETAITIGVVQGVEQELKGTIACFEQQFGKINTLMTGGDASVFEKRLKVPIFAAPNLVLYGLNAILNYNAGK